MPNNHKDELFVIGDTDDFNLWHRKWLVTMTRIKKKSEEENTPMY